MEREQKLQLINDCLFNLDELLNDLRVTNPIYRTSFDVGNNPVISFVARVMGRNPMYFADPIGENVRFDITKIEKLKIELEELKDRI